MDIIFPAISALCYGSHNHRRRDVTEQKERDRQMEEIEKRDRTGRRQWSGDRPRPTTNQPNAGPNAFEHTEGAGLPVSAVD